MVFTSWPQQARNVSAGWLHLLLLEVKAWPFVTIDYQPGKSLQSLRRPGVVTNKVGYKAR